VLDMVGHVHVSLAVEDDAVAGRFSRQRDEEFRFAVGRNFADGLLFLEIDGVDVAVLVAVGPFNANREAVVGGEKLGDEELLLGMGSKGTEKNYAKQRQ